MKNNQLSSMQAISVTKIYDYDPDLSYRPVRPHLHAIPAKPESKIDKYLMCFEQILNFIFKSLMVASCLALSFLVFSQVITRYFMDSSFNGIEETSILLAVWVYFLGMGYATRKREHIHGGIVTLVVKSQRKIAWIRLINTVICMLAACFFGYFAYKYAIGEILKGRVSPTLRWPRGIWSASMIVGFTMMVGYFLLEAITQYRDLLKPSSKSSDNSAQDQVVPTTTQIESQEV